MKLAYEVRVIEEDTKLIEEGFNGTKRTDFIKPENIEKFSNTTYGVFALTEMPLGNLVMDLSGSFRKTPSRTSIQVGERHLESAYGGYVNHNCNANTLLMIAVKNLDGVESVVPWYSRISGTISSMVIGRPHPVLVATTAISAEDEITFNYNHSESLLAEPFVCKCCGIWIRGKDYVEAGEKAMEIYEHRGYE